MSRSGKTNNRVYGVGKGLCDVKLPGHVEDRPHSPTYTQQHGPRPELRYHKTVNK
jgi:hypothetical protein